MKLSLKCKLENIVRNIDGTLTYYFRDIERRNKLDVFDEYIDKELRVDIDKWREKRSLDANAYSWVLQDQIAKKMGLSIDEVHDKMVLEYGVLETYSIMKEAWESAKRLFDYYKVLGESETNGKTFIHIRAGIGTHNYDSKEMSVFLDGVVQEAKQLGIETLDEIRLRELAEQWGKIEK